MPRPCNCNKCNINGLYEQGHCRRCWLYHNDNRYKQKWDMPELVEQISNFGKAIMRHIESSLENVDKTTFENRLKICNTCPKKTSDWRCTACGCFISIKAKWASEKCPENKWELPVVKTTNDGGCNCGTK